MKDSWEIYKKEIRQLFIVENRELKDVIDIMKKRHGFCRR